jgi:exopolyphosphatase/guanosine-5'-triphosphate,3'-diphosphate pyrophosphatase
MVLAAIDIGSNAIRLLISNVFEEQDRTIIKKFSLTRVPIRLGEDAFLQGRISVEKSLAVIKAMIAFKHLMEIHEPAGYMALATSAMRNADNGERIVEEIRKQTNLDVQIIDGQKEAEIIYSTHVAEEQLDGRAYLYIEVGGGSTELSLFDSGKNVFSRSFPVGTVRLLHDLIDKADWKEMKHWIKEHIHPTSPMVGIATGGNINAIFKMLGRSEKKTLSYKKLSKTRKYLESFTVDGRIKELGLRPDRADVIIPATQIYLYVMKWAGIDKIIVPKIGLADGIIRMLYENYSSGSGDFQSKSA